MLRAAAGDGGAGCRQGRPAEIVERNLADIQDLTTLVSGRLSNRRELTDQAWC